jgi:hypothetical protein
MEPAVDFAGEGSPPPRRIAKWAKLRPAAPFPATRPRIVYDPMRR